jgi:putative ABC transport system permease protein
MLKLKNVSKFYYNKGMITSGMTKINLELMTGEFVVITGESGSGKSTLLNVLSGLDSYEEGELYINGVETSHYTAAEFARYRQQYISNVFQAFNLVNSYTVYQNVELPMLINGHKRSEVKERVLKIIEQVGLSDHTKTKCSKLSGGQKQRVAIARALAKETPIIVADEPTGNLDSESGASVANLLKSIATDKLVIVVTHNYEQFADQATRVVKMSDGKIIEDREVQPCEKTQQLIEVKNGNISWLNQLMLGIRNTFNLLPKLLLLLSVFSFLVIATTSAYTSFKQQENTDQGFGYNNVFQHYSNLRIVVTKPDHQPITAEDFVAINGLPTIDYLEKNDLGSDIYLSAQSDTVYVSGYPSTSDQALVLDFGRMPEAANEFVVVGDLRNMNITDPSGVINQEFTMYNNFGNETKLILVGVKNLTQAQYNASQLIITQDKMDSLLLDAYQNYSKITVKINAVIYDGNYQYRVRPNSKVAKGSAYIPVDMNYLYRYGRSANQPIVIKIKNNFFESELTVKVKATFNKNNIKQRIGESRYEDHMNEIHINDQDFRAMFDQGIYQSSVFVKDITQVDQTIGQLEALGFNALGLKDTLFDYGGDEIIKIIQVPMITLFMLGVFFIAYFVTSLILKSRSVYFSTLRILGLHQQHLKRILDIELMLVVSLAYGLVVGLYQLTARQIIKFAMFENLVKYLNLSDYLILYVLLIMMALLLSRRVSRKIFKQAALVVYREEV